MGPQSSGITDEATTNGPSCARSGMICLIVTQEKLATVRGGQPAQPETAGVVVAARVHSEPSVSSQQDQPERSKGTAQL